MASEQVRWYNADNTIAEVVEGSKGKMVKPDIRHARKYRLLPSVTSICKAGQNGFFSSSLDKWMMTNVALTAAAYPFDGSPDSEDEKQAYANMVLAKSDEFRQLAADAGKAIHKDVEIGLMDGTVPENAVSAAVYDSVLGWLTTEGMEEWSCEDSLGSYDLGFAGTPDIVAKAGDRTVLIDLKTTDLTKFRTCYESWKLQLAAYRLLTGGTAELWQCVADRNTGEVRWFQHDDLDYWVDCWNAIYDAFCVAKKYDPRKDGE